MTDLLPRLLHPAYWHWQKRPAEMFGFWLWTGAEDLRDAVRRTGASATSLHLPLYLLKDDRARYGVRPLPAPVQVVTCRTMEMEFSAPTGVMQVHLLLTTSDSHAEAVTELSPVKPAGIPAPLVRAQTEPRSQPHIILRFDKPLPAGRYRVRVRVTRSHAHSWLGQAMQGDTLVRLGDVALRGWAVIGEWTDAIGRSHRFTRRAGQDTPVPLGTSAFVTLANLRVDAGVGVGEHNNAFFVTYPDWFWQMHPQAAMRDRDGNIIRAGENPWIAVDDPVLTDAALRQLRETIPLLRHQKRVRYWVIGGEQGYPDYFGLPEGDFRPEFLAHYRAWRKKQPEPHDEELRLWRRFREAAMTERFALYTTALRQLDPTRPVFIPTHGNPFALDFRVKMGFPLVDLAGVADGFEAGPISIDDDAERIHRMTLDMQTGFGVPVVAPRLANKQLDHSARGGGKSFSPQSVRRTVYEALGMGVWHIGLVQWRGSLPDGEWGIQDTSAEAECKRLFAELRQAAPWLEGCSRLFPQIGVFLSDAVWQRWWQDRWTLLYDIACSRGWNTMFVHDAQCGAELAQVVPVLLSVDNPVMTQRAHRALGEYLRSGGKVLAVGAFAEQDERGDKLPPLPEGVLRLPDDASGATVSVIHQTSTDRGAATWSAKVRPLPLEQLEKHLERLALLRPVLVTAPDSAGWAEGVECLLLTDGVNLAAALLHRADYSREVQVSLCPRLPSLRARGFERSTGILPVLHMRDAVTGQVLSRSLPARVLLEPYGARLLLIERVVSHETCKQEAARAERAIARWREKGVDVAPFAGWLQSAIAHQKAQRFAKAFALARNVTGCLAIKPSVRRTGETLHIKATVWQPDGTPADGAQVRVRLTPSAFRWQSMEHEGEGVFSIALRFPCLYSPTEARYTPVKQGVTLILDARMGGLCGGARVMVGTFATQHL
ncbi:MAG: hypothetical protein RMM08_00775 [Armatimonadota bacterium]|nr:hypothetical protein [Armatimonadota bacterium]